MAIEGPLRRIVFCDFDGTITVEETFVGMVRRFARRDHGEIAALVEQGLMTQSEAVRLLVSSIPASALPGIRSYIRAQRLRPGFSALLTFLSEQGIPLVVVTGGLREQAEILLAPYRKRIRDIHAARTTVQDYTLTVSSDYEGNGELVCKHLVMKLYDYDEAVVIGDGESDISMAVTADLVFARGELCSLMEARGKSYLGWQTFVDVLQSLRRLWFEKGAREGSSPGEANPTHPPQRTDWSG